MKTLVEKVFDKLNDRNPDLLAEIIDEIEAEDRDRVKDVFNPFIDTGEDSPPMELWEMY